MRAGGQAWRCLARVVGCVAGASHPAAATTAAAAATTAAAAAAGMQQLSRSICVWSSSWVGQVQQPWQHHWPTQSLCQWQQPAACRRIHASSAASAQDFYDVLGVSRGASDQAIKKAYYTLAKKYHPDTNKDNPEAAKQFQEVSKAYETLRDPEKRRMYDSLGREGMNRMEEGMGGAGFEDAWQQWQGPGGGAWSAQDILNHFFGAGAAGGGFRGAGGAMFSTIMVDQPLRLTFMEACKGVRKSIDLTRLTGMKLAPVEVDLPPGLNTGQTIQVQAKPSDSKQQPINLMLAIEVEPHPQFKRHGYDIVYELVLKLSEGLTGKTITVPTIDGQAELVVPPCTLSGDVLRMQGRGIDNPRTGQRGSQLVPIRLVKPRKLTAKQQQLLKEFAAEDK